MSTRGRTVRVGTRGSDLAVRQAATIKETLEQRRLSVDLVEVETRGDQIRDELIHRLGTTGAFVRTPWTRRSSTATSTPQSTR